MTHFMDLDCNGPAWCGIALVCRGPPASFNLHLFYGGAASLGHGMSS